MAGYIMSLIEDIQEAFDSLTKVVVCSPEDRAMIVEWANTPIVEHTVAPYRIKVVVNSILPMGQVIVIDNSQLVKKFREAGDWE